MDRDPGDQRRASLRASDADREQFVETLRRHHARAASPPGPRAPPPGERGP